MNFKTKAPLREQIAELQDEVEHLDDRIDSMELDIPDDFKQDFEKIKASVAALEQAAKNGELIQGYQDRANTRLDAITDLVESHEETIVSANNRLTTLEKAPLLAPRLDRMEILLRRLSEETIGIPETNALWRQFP